MPPKKPAEPPPEEPPAEGEGEEEPEPVPRTVEEILADFLAAQPDDPDAASAALAAELEIEEPTTDLRNGARLDFLVNTAVFARDAGFSLAQAAYLHAVATAMLEVAADAKMTFDDAERRFQHALVTRATASPADGHFTVDDIRVVSAHFAANFFAHFKLFAYAYRNEQAVEQHATMLFLETPFAFKKLPDAYTQERWEAKLVRDKEAEEAERARLEEEARVAAEEAERARKEEEEAERVRKEEQEARRRPKTLDEAVAHAVREKLKLERAALEAEYAAREEQLLTKIAALEAQMK
jgi:hypothetical protein